jgi:hypothetical protein
VWARAVHEDELRPGLVASARSQVHPEGQRPEEALGLGGDVRTCPLVGEVREFLASGAVGLAAAVGVVGGSSGVVVARDTRDGAFLDEGDHLVGPGSVAYEIAEMVDRANVLSCVYVLKHRLKSGQVGVDVRDQGVLHGCLRYCGLVRIKNSLYVLCGARVTGPSNIVGVGAWGTMDLPADPVMHYPPSPAVSAGSQGRAAPRPLARLSRRFP